jgi:hypothetical protein
MATTSKALFRGAATTTTTTLLYTVPASTTTVVFIWFSLWRKFWWNDIP